MIAWLHMAIYTMLYLLLFFMVFIICASTAITIIILSIEMIKDLIN